MLREIPGAFYVAEWNNITLVRWEQPADAVRVAMLDKVSDEFAVAHPGLRQSGVHIIVEGVTLPTSEARAGLMKMVKARADLIAAVAVVIMGSGFLVSALRSFLTGLRLAGPRSFDFRLHGKISEVTKWFPEAHRRYTGEELDPRELERTVTSFAVPSSRTKP